MHEAASLAEHLEADVSSWIAVLGIGIDVFGVLVIVLGIVWATYLFLRRRMAEEQYSAYKLRIGRALLLGLEVLVAADIVKTIALEPTFVSLGVLAGLVLIRTFPSWTLVLEIEGCWPWQAGHPRAEFAVSLRAASLDGQPTRAMDRAASIAAWQEQ